ncbi:hypothetical protein Taro_056250 [Colocasia esculenta]|uniref:Epidermal patterning factor-like protein n=1 Tax=Colocasia esculenta TaxID=4460 RepID=A0A843XWS0_COLES|nr:hypothetical protein [Colocasia esculenta]
MVSLKTTAAVHLVVSLLFVLPTPLPGRRIGPADLDAVSRSHPRLFLAVEQLEKPGKKVETVAGHDHRANQEQQQMMMRMRRRRRGGFDTVQVAGSSLPDCSHACGSCSPCRLVMVSFVCASLTEAETCPMAYKCMCNRKSYPVP